MRATRARNINTNKKDLSPEQREEVLAALKARFEKNINRHKGVTFNEMQLRALFAECVVPPPINSLSDFRWPPKYLRSRERQANRGWKSWVQVVLERQ